MNEKALAARIDRALKKNGMRLRRSRSTFLAGTGFIEPGDYFIIDVDTGGLLSGPCDLAELQEDNEIEAELMADLEAEKVSGEPESAGVALCCRQGQFPRARPCGDGCRCREGSR